MTTAPPATRARATIGDRLAVAAMAAVAYVPLLATKPGTASVDTKVYLYLDPGRLLERAVSMWDSHIGFGTVPHQQIGYLFPMGPFFWLAETAGLPDWLAQRLWLGTLLLAAGLGARFLARTLGWTGPAATAIGFVYLLSPYVLHYAAKHSIILAPWSGLPWLVAFTVRAVRRGGWRDAAWFALVAQIVGGVNATALVLVGVGPLLWLVHAVWGIREVSVRRAAAAAGRIGVLTLVTSVWWMAGLWVQGRYGIDIVRYTETPEAVANASTAPEVLRQLGYWFFYGKDKFGPHVGAAALDYTQRPWLIAVGFGVTALAFAAAAIIRWRHRLFVVLLLVSGTALSVGAHPWDGAPLLGRVLRVFLASDVGLAMRSMPRALPLLVLGIALALGAAVIAVGQRVPGRAWLAAVGVVAIAAANQPALFTGGFIADPLSRPEDLPPYWQEVATWLDENDDGTRVLELPGIDFASYRWGTTVDPVTPGLMDRPYAAREIVTHGTPPSADLLNAFDRRLQEGVLDPEAVAPIARLMRVGHLVLRNDITFERYRTARPRFTTALVLGADGLGPPVEFGGDAPNRPIALAPLLDEQELGAPELDDPAQVVVVPVSDAVPIVRAAASDQPIVVAADGEGLVDLAGAGLIHGDETIHYAASLGPDLPGLAANAVVVVTDTNRLRGRRWSTVRENSGYTEPADEEPLEVDSSNQPLPLFPGAGPAWFTVAEHRGGATARASAYGNPVSLTAEDRPVNALDGDPLTAWQTNAFAPTAGERLVIEVDQPVTTDRLVLLQPFTGARNRWITRAGLRFDDEDEVVEVDLGDASRAEPGQAVEFDRRTFSRVEIEILEDTVGRTDHYDGLSAVGFAEVRIDDIEVDELLRLPTGLLDELGADSLDHDLALVMTRARTDPSNSVRHDEETHLARTFTLPTGRTFALEVQARLADGASDELINRLLGAPVAAGGGVTATASSRLPGAPDAGAAAAVDGDPGTAWVPAFLASAGAWVEVETPAVVELDRLRLQVVADGRHSLPARLRIEADGGEPVVVDVPDVEAGSEARTVVPIDLALPRPVTGRTIRVTVEEIRPVTTIDYYLEAPIDLPIGVAELGLPGVTAVAAPAAGRAPSDCHSGLLTMDGRDVPLRLSATVGDLVAGVAVTARPCGPAATELELASGTHDIRSAPGATTGIDLDRLVLRSAAGGAAAATGGRLVPRDQGTDPPAAVRVVDSSSTAITVEVRDAVEGRPFWLELGQSHSSGWEATVDGVVVSGPELLDGFANGWLVDPPSERFTVELRFTAQRWVWYALAISVAGLIGCLMLALWPRRSRAEAPPAVAVEVADPLAYVGGQPPLTRRVVVVAGLAIGTLVVAGLVVAAVTALLAIVALTWRHARPVLLFGGPAAVLLAGAGVAAGQVLFEPPVGLQWPGLYESLHPLGWLGVALLVAEVVVATAWRRARAPKPGRSPATAPPVAFEDGDGPRRPVRTGG